MSETDNQPVPLRRPGSCPICKKAANRQNFPFCSRRCRDVDLNRWLEGSYRIAGTKNDEDDLFEPSEKDDQEQ